MRIGVIGVGRIGALHAETLRGLDEVTEVIVTDVAQDLSAAVAARLGCRAALSPEALIAEGLDGIVIAASTGAHPDLLRSCIAAGTPTFCEKPIATDPLEAADIARLAVEAGVSVQIGYPRRFDPGFVALKKLVDSGALGRTTTVRSTTMDPAPPPASYLAGSGGIFRDCAVHDFDTVRWITGREVVEVFATGTGFSEAGYDQLDDVSSAAAVLTLDDGTLAVVSNARYNGGGYDVRLEVHGTKQTAAAGLDDRLPMRSVEPGVLFPAGPAATFFMDRLDAAFRAELVAFVDVATGRRASPCTLDDALETTWVAEACALSLRTNAPVRLADIRSHLAGVVR